MYTPEKDWWDMGIVIYAPFRGKGYAVPALKLMLDHAFLVCGISRIHNDFEVARNEIAAWETHRKAGFKELGVEDGFLQMMITKEDYFGATQKVPIDDQIASARKRCKPDSTSATDGNGRILVKGYPQSSPKWEHEK